MWSSGLGEWCCCGFVIIEGIKSWIKWLAIVAICLVSFPSDWSSIAVMAPFFLLCTSWEIQAAGKEYCVLVIHLCHSVFYIPEQTVWHTADVHVPDDTVFILL